MNDMLNSHDGGGVALAGNEGDVELHPWEPYVPARARVLIMGTFPPKPHRWSMDFYYPNRTNDFWRVMGIIFFNDPLALYDSENKRFRLDEIKLLLDKEGIALHDTGHKVRRLKDNASDKFLEILEPVDLKGLLEKMPCCGVVVTTGEKAAGVLAALTGTTVPKTGEFTDVIYEPLGRKLRIWRMPSTSRAYPLAPEKKAEFYKKMFDDVKSRQWDEAASTTVRTRDEKLDF